MNDAVPRARAPHAARRRRPQGLPAPVGDVHRAGARRAGAARPRARALLAAPPDRPRRAPGARRRSRRRSTYLPEYLHDEPARVLRALARRAPPARLPRRRARPSAPTSRATARATACAASARRWCSRPSCRRDIARLHAHFLHTPASVTRYAALMRGLPWSVLGAREGHLDHAGVGEAREARVAAPGRRPAPRANAEHLRASGAGDAGEGRPRLSRPRRAPLSRPARSPAPTLEPVVVLAVGRAVEKKGFDDLLRALARPAAPLPTGASSTSAAARCCPRSQAQAQALGLAARISWHGAVAAAAGARALSRARTSSRCRRASRPTATATGCPTC